MILYLVKFTACLFLFLLVYKLFMERERFHRFKRFYLLCFLFFSLAVPFAVIEATAIEQIRTVHISKFNTGYNSPAKHFSIAQRTPHFSAGEILLYGYCIITLFFLARYIRNLLSIRKKILNGNNVPYKGAILVISNDQVASHTFLKYIFINESLYKNPEKSQEILSHELTHARQMHTLDILLIELLRVLFWFNPVLYFYKKAMQLNHEFLADDVVVRTYRNGRGYQELMLSIAGLPYDCQLSSNFNYAITKKRLMMISRPQNVKAEFFKQLLLVPVVSAAIFLFAERLGGVGDAKIPVERSALQVSEEKNHRSRSVLAENNAQSVERHEKSHFSKKTHINKVAPDLRVDVNDDEALYSHDSLRSISSRQLVAPSEDNFTNGIFISEDKIRFAIDRTTTKEELQDYGNALWKNDISLEIDKIEYTEDSEIEQIKLTIAGQGFIGKIDRSLLSGGPAGFAIVKMKAGATSKKNFTIF